MSKLTNILFNSLKLQNGRFYLDDGITIEVDNRVQINKIKDFIKQLKKPPFFWLNWGMGGRRIVIEFLKHKEYQEASKDVLNEIESVIEGSGVNREKLYKELARVRRELRLIIDLHKEGTKVETLDYLDVFEFYKKCGDEVNRRAIKLLDKKLNNLK